MKRARIPRQHSVKMARIAHAIAVEASVADVQSMTRSIRTPTGDWHDLESAEAPDKPWVERAAQYLELAARLERDPVRPSRVRIAERAH